MPTYVQARTTRNRGRVGESNDINLLVIPIDYLTEKLILGIGTGNSRKHDTAFCRTQ